VQAVNGLDNRPVPAKHLSADPPITGLLTPQQVAQLYNFPSGTGLGQTIGIFTAWVAAPNGVEPHTDTNGYQLDDVTATLANWGVTAAPPKDFPHGSNPGSPTEYYAEPVMDIAIATAVAPKASIVVYFMPEWSAAAIISTLTSMVHPVGSDPVPTVLSISYWFSADDDTSFLSPEDYTQIDTLFQDAANLGVTVLTGSNDYGAYFSSPTQAQTVYPASDPYVLTCGGTTIGDINGSDFDEYVWNDTWTLANGNPASGATGGGISALFPVPPYQATIDNLPKRNGTGTAGRGIPDVAGNASPNSGYVITLNQNTFPPNPPGGTGVGGTSIVAPLYAGLIARINESLGENVGFLNPTIYALAPAICRDVTGAAGPTNNNYAGPTATPPVAVTGYSAGVGWDACTGWGSIDGSALLSALQGIFQKSMTFIMERTTFGPDEVAATDGVFDQAFFVVVDGLKPSDFPGVGGITTTSLTPPPTQTQLNQWAPVIPSPIGPGGVATNITFTPTAVSSEGPSLSPEVQRFTFTYQVTFPDKTAFTIFPVSDFPLLLTLNASLAAIGGIPDASAQIELIQGGDPYFSSESNGGLFWLSEDIRVFYAIEGSTLFGYPAPGLGNSPTEARSFIQWIAANLSGPLGTGPNGDSFENTLPVAELTSALSLYPTVPGPESELNVYNFAIARVRLNGTSAADAAKVRIFFRLFQSQSTTTPYQAPPPDTGSPVVSPLNSPYRQWSDGNKDGRKIPLLGTSPDGTQYVTVPCFAAERATNTSMANNMWTQSDPTNVTTIEPAADGSTVYAYFGAWLDTNQSDQIFPYKPGANPDGPFTGQTLYTVSQVLNRGGHQCLVVEIVDDEAPIPDSATPATSDKIAQRNLAYRVVANSRGFRLPTGHPYLRDKTFSDDPQRGQAPRAASAGRRTDDRLGKPPRGQHRVNLSARGSRRRRAGPGRQYVPDPQPR
jgi:kumamolisin